MQPILPYRNVIHLQLDLLAVLYNDLTSHSQLLPARNGSALGCSFANWSATTQLKYELFCLVAIHSETLLVSTLP